MGRENPDRQVWQRRSAADHGVRVAQVIGLPQLKTKTASTGLIEATFRDEAAGVVAGLVAWCGDFARAEDAFQDALVKALTDWGANGIPDRPGAWLTTVARRRIIDASRRAETRRRFHLEVAAPVTHPDDAPRDETAQKLALIFTACHPSLPPEGQAALTLKVVGGLSTPRIAAAFLVPEATLAQRIVRAKRKIRDAGIPFRIPPEHLRAERLNGVLRVLYLIFNEGYSDTAASDTERAGLVDDAIRLADTLLALMPGDPEVLGLLALMLAQNARRAARSDDAGLLVPLEKQDRSLWNREMISHARALLELAAQAQRPGPYQLQAAIALNHALSSSWADTDWVGVVRLYDGLAILDRSPVVAINRAAALAMRDGPEAALAALEEIDNGALSDYQPFHAARADLLRRAGHSREAAEAYERAIDLASSEAQRRFLKSRLKSLGT